MPVTLIRVLWLKDDRPGHINKVKGFLAALANAAPLEITEWRVRWRFSVLRHLVGRLHSTRWSPAPSSVLRGFPPPGAFDLIVSAGGLTQWPNAWLAQHLRIPNVYIGSPHHFAPDAFTLIPLTDPPHERPPFLKLVLVPSEVSPDAARRCAREHFPALGETGWTLLLGGDGEGLQWSEEDFIGLTEGFLTAAGAAGQKVCVATSRRTPVRVEAALRQRCEKFPGLIAGAWFHASGGQTLPLLALLGASHRIVVTADSVSMTNEAVASGVPAVAIYPSVGVANARHELQFSRLEREGRLARLRLPESAALSDVEPPGGWHLITGDPQAELAGLALERLGLRVDT